MVFVTLILMKIQAIFPIVDLSTAGLRRLTCLAVNTLNKSTVLSCKQL